MAGSRCTSCTQNQKRHRKAPEPAEGVNATSPATRAESKRVRRKQSKLRNAEARIGTWSEKHKEFLKGATGNTECPKKPWNEKDTLEVRAKRRDFAPRRDAACDPLPRKRLRLYRLQPLNRTDRKEPKRVVASNDREEAKRPATAPKETQQTPKRKAKKGITKIKAPRTCLRAEK